MPHGRPAPDSKSHANSRRDFLKVSGTAALAGALAGGLLVPRAVHAAGGDTLKIGLIGCGGRGSSAANEALSADENCQLFAMGDAFEDRGRASREGLRRRWGPKVEVPDDRLFVGFDAYQRVIDSGVDVVILTTPPHFRPAHLKAAIAAGKHVFCEKPVAVDAPGVRSVLETVKVAEQKGLSLVSGLCWRYDYGVRETMKRVLDGQIGEIVAIQENYLAGPLWYHDRRPEWSDMEYQVRNWLYYTWLSGDHNVEQHVHSLDKAGWANHDEPPLQATGLGGRQVRVEQKWGNIFDHHAVCYEYASGVRVFAFTRQQKDCTTDVEDYILGTAGRCEVLKHTIYSKKGEVAWKYSGPKPSMYQVEHNELFASIRAGKPINNGLYMARSTMLAILGRMTTYTGKTITWDQALASREDLSPKAYEWGPVEFPKVAMPGVTEFV